MEGWWLLSAVITLLLLSRWKRKPMVDLKSGDFMSASWKRDHLYRSGTNDNMNDWS